MVESVSPRGSLVPEALLILALMMGCSGSTAPAPLEVVNVHTTLRRRTRGWQEFMIALPPPWRCDCRNFRLGRHKSALGSSKPTAFARFSSWRRQHASGRPPKYRSPLAVAGSVRALFAGQVTNWSDVGGAVLSVEIWTYSPAVDVQANFDQAVMNGRPVTSLARLAVSAQAMSDSISSVPGSVGVLPRRLKPGNAWDALALPSLPVLAIVKAEPEGAIKSLLSCMQSADLSVH